MVLRSLLTLFVNLAIVNHYASAQTQPAAVPQFDRARDVIYGRSWGTSLTMDVFTPPKDKRNGIGVIWVVSGGWYSAPEAINDSTIHWFAQPPLDRGYTVLAVCHGPTTTSTTHEAGN